MKAHDLKCCGNCHNKTNTKYNPFGCLRPGDPDEVCYNWIWDDKKYFDRLKSNKQWKILQEQEMRSN